MKNITSLAELGEFLKEYPRAGLINGGDTFVAWSVPGDGPDVPVVRVKHTVLIEWLREGADYVKVLEAAIAPMASKINEMGIVGGTGGKGVYMAVGYAMEDTGKNVEWRDKIFAAKEAYDKRNPPKDAREELVENAAHVLDSWIPQKNTHDTRVAEEMKNLIAALRTEIEKEKK